jgi:hypothetical protein
MSGELTKEALKIMREHGGKWAAYSAHRTSGSLQFVPFGNGTQYDSPPVMIIDDEYALSYKLWLVGPVNVEEEFIDTTKITYLL